MRPALQALSTQSPCQLKTGPVSSVQTNPHVHRVHSVVYVQLDRRSVSNISSVRIRFVQHDNVSSLNYLLHRNDRFDNTRAPVRYAPLNSFICLVWNYLLAKSLICSPFAATILFGAILRSSLTRGKIVSSITWPAAPESLVTLTFTHLSFTSMISFWFKL